MTNELKKITKKIDREFIKYFIKDLEMETIFVVGSMADEKYADRQDNDYDIRVITTNVNKNKIIEFEKFLNQLSKKLTTKNIEVGYSCLVGPINHKISQEKKNILIHAMIHRKDQMDNFLPITHKYQYGKNYRIVYGKDNLKKFKEIRYNLEDIINAHEGLKYCIDMLKKKEYRYLTWDTEGKETEFNYHKEPMKDDKVMEACFYSANKFVNNLISYCNFENYDIPENRIIFCIRLLGKEKINEKVLFLLQGLLNKSEFIMNKIFDDPLEPTIKLLEIFKEKIYTLDEKFEKKEEEKVKKLVRN